MKQCFVVIFLCIYITSCNYIINPYTAVPAAVLGVYEKANKREKWLDYAEKGDIYSQFELAESYCCRDLEGKRNNKESFKWYCIAAKNGYAKAQVEMGKFYENIRKLQGVEIPKDDIKAIMWYGLAARRVNDEARKKRDRLRDVITNKEIRAANKMASNIKNFNCQHPS